MRTLSASTIHWIPPPPPCSSFATENRDFMQDNSTVNTAHTANANFKRLLSGFTRRHLLACHLIAFEPEPYPTFYDVAFFLRRVQSFNNIARFSTAPTWWSELVEDFSARDFYVKISRNSFNVHRTFLSLDQRLHGIKL